MKLVKSKIEKTLRSGLSAWWVFLIMIAYTWLSSRFLGTGCLLASTTGIPCPGCGMTRAVFALLHGDIHASLHYHPLLIPSAVGLLVYFLIWLTHDKTPKYANNIVIALMVAMGATYAIRMIAFFPHEVPMVINRSSVLFRLIELVF